MMEEKNEEHMKLLQAWTAQLDFDSASTIES